MHFIKKLPTCKVNTVFSPSNIVLGKTVPNNAGKPEYYEKP